MSGRSERSGTGLLGDGLALGASVGINAVVGLVAWIVAARLMPAADVGIASAFVSAFILVAGCTGLNLGVAMLRWLPGSGAEAGILVRRCSVAVVLLSIVAASGYLLLPGSAVIFEAATGSPSPSLAGWLIFGVAAAAWSLFQLHDLVLVGLRRSWWAPAKNVLASVVRLAALLVLGAGLTSQAVVLSWVVPTVLCAGVVAVLAAVVARRMPGPPTGDARLPDRREVLDFLGPTYVGQLAMSLLYFQVPLLVIFRFGPAAGAAFFFAWQVVTVVDVVAFRFVNALVGHVAQHPERGVELSRVARNRLLVLLLPGLAAGLLLAGPMLSVFGPAYVVATPALQVLLVGSAFRLLVVHSLGVRQAFGDALGFARLQLGTTLLVLVGMLLVPVGEGDGPGVALLRVALVHLAVQVVFALPLLLPRGTGSAVAVQERAAARAGRRSAGRGSG